jgi:hypothetical protein
MPVRRALAHLREWSGVAALLLVLTGGVAYAANTVASSDIIDGEVKTQDLAANAVNSSKISDGQVTEADIGQGAVATAELKNDAVTSQKVLNDTLVGNDVAANTLKGADIDEATLDIGDAARAYAVVHHVCSGGTPAICAISQSKGVSGVTRASTGRYCVTAPGIDAEETPAAVTVDWGLTVGAGNTSAMTREAFGCGPGDGGFEVVTERQFSVTVDKNGGTNNQAAVEPAELADSVSFSIVIP